uniref:Ig-like domain-containing protein n=1 Tax=Chelonoidis abingdonii TaxID=106734 RepID=A0A8C0IQN6_CHEAB
MPPLLLCLGQVWCFQGFEAQELDTVVSRVAEGQRLIVECHYNYWDYSATPKTWCQLRDEKCFPLVSTSYTSDRYQNKVTSGRATIEDDTGNAIVTITMEKLQVQDSGVYWCARYYLPSTMYPLKTIKLDVSKVMYHLLLFTGLFNLGLFFFVRSVICIVVAPWTSTSLC